ncbi:unnamed protein product [Miscanthus lutarioriparius]|uniref:Sulfurtransferase n=1 Tax=Miscanthus lutarioriparius TaxID=422564 RepID=A0A811RDX6_9POAL|nr:unnamed protein product [Miscanthus lutarioriparius]
MAQDDPVVSAQWLQEHLGMPDVKVAHIPGALFFDLDGIVDRTTDTNTITFQTEFQPNLFWTLEKASNLFYLNKIAHIQIHRFDGVAPEPRKGVRSAHIPGSICVPFPEMFDGAPSLLSADELRQKFQQAGISLDQPIAVTCGSGVTACIVALGLYRIGKHDVPVYDGSWTEWEAQSDSDYPKVTAPAC